MVPTATEFPGKWQKILRSQLTNGSDNAKLLLPVAKSGSHCTNDATDTDNRNDGRSEDIHHRL